MVRQATGKPKLVLRLPQEVIDLLMERAEQVYGPAARGSSGGASRLARTFIYQGLALEPPPEFGSKNPERNRKLREKRAAARLAAEEAAIGGGARRQ